LLDFTAIKQGPLALVQWKTATEINSGYFDLERSDDAINFVYIGRITAAGNSSREINYSFTDHQPLNGVNYYRLKQVDLNGHVIYSPSRMLRFENGIGGAIKYYPNPTHGIVTIEITPLMQQQPMVINISNAWGIVVDQLKIRASASYILQVNLSRFAKGTYFIQVKTNISNSVQRIIFD
jgi:hypothetical protein